MPNLGPTQLIIIGLIFTVVAVGAVIFALVLTGRKKRSTGR